jgi:hypothetical protein
MRSALIIPARPARTEIAMNRPIFTASAGTPRAIAALRLLPIAEIQFPTLE